MSTMVHTLDQPARGTECPWRNEAGAVCGEWVTKDNCAAHLASWHGIKSISARHMIKCQACNRPNFIKRESMLRHFLEVHIKIRRKLCKKKERVVINQFDMLDCGTDVSHDPVEG